MTGLTVADRLEIIELQSRYAWAIDGRETNLFGSVFTDDVDGDYSEFVHLHGVEQLGRWMEAFHTPFDSTQHLIANHWVQADGGTARYRSYVQVTLVQHTSAAGRVLQTAARYDDRVVRSSQGWRIATRQVTNMWRTGAVELLEIGRQTADGVLR